MSLREEIAARMAERAAGAPPSQPAVPAPDAAPTKSLREQIVARKALRLERDEELADQTITEAFTHSVGTNLDQKAATLRLAEATGADPDFVQDNFQAIESSWIASGMDARTWRKENAFIDQMIRRKPALAEIAVRDEKLSDFTKSMELAAARDVMHQLDTAKVLGVDPDAWNQLGTLDRAWEMLKLSVRAGPFREIPDRFPVPAEVAAAEETIARAEGRLPPKQVVTLEDARAAEGRAETGLFGRGRAVLMSLEDAQADIRASQAGFALGMALIKGGDGVYEAEKRLIAAEQDVKPRRDYKATTDFEQLLHDTARSTLPSQIESMKFAGVGAMVAGGATFAWTRNPVKSLQAAVGVGAKLGGGAASFVLESGSFLREARHDTTDQNDPLDKHVIVGTALVVGAVNAYIETFSFGKTAELFGGALGKAAYDGKLKDYFRKAMGSDASFRRIAAKAAKAWLEGGGIEMLEEFTQNIVHDVAAWSARSIQADVPQAYSESKVRLEAAGAAVEALKGSLVVGAGSVVTIPAQMKAARAVANRAASLRGAEVVGAIVEGGKSPTAKANPAAMAELVRAASEQNGEEVTHLYADAGLVTALYQDPTKILGPDAAAKLDEANLTGEKIAIPLETYYREIAGTPQVEKLAPHLTVRPGHATGFTIEAETVEDEKAANELAKEYIGENATPPASDAEKRLVDAVRVQLEQAGVHDKKKAEWAVALQRAFLRTQAKRHGVSADDLFADYALRVERGQEQPDVPATVPETPAAEANVKALEQPEEERHPRGFTQRAGKWFREVLNPNADLSTHFHESGHIFLEILGDLADRENAPQAVKDEWARIVAYLGTERTAKWEDGTPTFPTEAHEKWAKAFEKYLYEGVAPSEELEGAFARFKRWLKQVYKSAAGLGVELNPEIRGIFDRMLATDEELAGAVDEIGGLPPLFLTAEEAGMTAEQYRDYVDAREKAMSTAQRRAEVKALKERLWNLETWWKDEAATLEEQAVKDYEALPERQAWMYLHGQLRSPDGKSLGGKVHLDRAQVKAVLGADDAKRLPTKIEGGEDIDDVASHLGLGSGAEMLKALAALPDRKTWVKGRVDAQMREAHPDLLEDRQRLRELVREGLNGPYTLKFLLAEWAALRKKAGQKGETNLKRLRRTAEIIAERMPIADLVPYRILQRERAAAEKTAREAAKGRFALASAARQQQVLNMLLYSHVLRLRDEMAGAKRNLSRTTTKDYRARLARGGEVFLALHDAVLAAAGITDPTEQAQPEALTALSEVVRLAAADNNAIDAGLAEVIQGLLLQPGAWKRLLPDQARAVNELVHHIRALADHRISVMLGEQELMLDEVAFRLEQEARDLGDHGLIKMDSSDQTSWRRLNDKVWGANGELLDPMTLLFQMGSVGEDIWRAFNAALDEKYRLKNEVFDEFEKRWAAMPKEMMRNRFKNVPGIQDELAVPESIPAADRFADRDRLWLIMVALNMGNTSNRERLLGPFEWTESQVLEVLNKHLTKAEWDFVQSIWDVFDEKLWPEIAAKERRKVGLPPPKIEATSIQTPHGTYRGGYFPARYDYWLGNGVARRLQESGNRLSGMGNPFAATPSSHRKARAAHYEDVISLNWNVVPSHISQVLHDVAYDEFVRATARILENQNVRATIIQRFGRNRVTQLETWLRHVSSAQMFNAADLQSEIAQFAKGLHSRSVIGALGWSFTTAFADLSNPFVYMAKSVDKGGVSLYYGIQGYLQALPTSPWGTHYREFALSKSAELKRRNEALHDRHREAWIRAIGKRMGWPRKALEAVGNTVWFFMDLFDKLGSTAIWLARYRFEMAMHGDEASAIQKADDAVEQGLPSHEMIKKPQIVRNPGFIGSLMAYMGWFLKMYDMIFGQVGHQRVKKSRRALRTRSVLEIAKTVPLEAFKWAGQSAAMLFFSNVMGEVLAFRGPDEDEPLEDYVYKQWLAAPATLIPIVGGVGEAKIRELISGKKERYSWRSAPSMAFFESNARRISKIMDEESSTDEQVFAALEIGLTGAKLGVTQPSRTFRAFYQMVNGELDPDDFQALIAGPPNLKRPRRNLVSLFER